MSTTKTVARRNKKEVEAAAAAPAAPAAPAVEAAAAAAPVKEKRSKKAAAAAAPAPAVEVAAPAPVEAAPAAVVEEVAAAAPVHRAAEALLKELDERLQAHEQAAKALEQDAKNLRRAVLAITKAHARELKEAGRRRRKPRTTEGGEKTHRHQTTFVTPLSVSDQLTSFLGLAKGDKIAPKDVTRKVSSYINDNGLRQTENAQKGQTRPIRLDSKLARALGQREGDEIPYRSLQGLLYKQYQLPQKAKASAAN